MLSIRKQASQDLIGGLVNSLLLEDCALSKDIRLHGLCDQSMSAVAQGQPAKDKGNMHASRPSLPVHRLQETSQFEEGQVPKGPFKATLVAREKKFIYLRTVLDDDNLQRLKPKLEAHTAASSAPKEVSIGDAVCAPAKDQMWCRAIVDSMARTTEIGELFRVFTVDHGTMEVVRKDALRLLPRDLVICLPCLAVKVGLDGVVGRLTDGLLRPFMGQELSVEVTARGNGPPNVVAFGSSGACLNSILRPLAIKRAQQAAFEERPLPDGRTKVKISHVSDLGQLVYLQPLKLLPALQFLMVELNIKPPAALQRVSLGNGVCARHPGDGDWYRAVIMSDRAEDGKWRVRFVDYGYSQLLPIQDIRALPEGMQDVPLFAICVGLKCVKTISKQWKENLQSHEFGAEVVNRDRLPNQVKLFDEEICINAFVR